MAVQTRATITPYAEAGVSVIALTLHGWNGWIPSMQAINDEYLRLGGEGSGSQIVGKRGRKKEVFGWHGFLDEAAALAFAGRWEAMEAQTARVVDGYGRNMPRVRFTSCQVEVKRGRGPALSAVTQVLFRVECTATAERLADA